MIEMELKRSDRSRIEGSCKIEGREGTIECDSVEHGLNLPYDRSTANPSGRRVHHPVTVSKRTDKSTPVLYQALVTGEKLAEAKFTYYRTSPQGNEEKFFVKTLTDATIIDIQAHSSAHSLSEQVIFAYEAVFWTYLDGGISAADSWRSASGKG